MCKLNNVYWRVCLYKICLLPLDYYQNQNTKTMKKFCFTLLTLLTLSSYAQEHHTTLPSLAEKVAKADAVIEGMVIETKGYDSKDKSTIYTSALVRVSKIFKGTVSDIIIELVFEGGYTDEHRLIMWLK